jgi:hypothetical protein
MKRRLPFCPALRFPGRASLIGQDAGFADAGQCRMVGPVSRARTEQLGIVLAVALSARAASAKEAEFTLKCGELSLEDAAQVEARVRADLLSARLTPLAVDLSCEADSAQTQVTGSGHQVTLRTDCDAGSVKEALLASAEGALSAWGARVHPAEAIPLAPPSPTIAPPVSKAMVPEALRAAPVGALATANRLPDARPTLRSSAGSTWISAGTRAELWHNGGALGGQLGLQRKWASMFVAVRAAYLVNVPGPTDFSAHELQLGAEIGLEPQGLLGLRGALGVGSSTFDVTPAAGVSTQNSTSSTLACLSFELSRPVAFGRFALVPALGGRAFSRARRVSVDGQELLALPAVALEASLSFSLKAGR